MRSSVRRKLCVAALAAGVILPGTTCSSTDTQSSLAELAATTSGSLVQILVQAYLDQRIAATADPELGAPIAEQEH